MLLAGSEIRRRDKLLNRNRAMNAKRLAEFVQSLEQEETSLRAQRILLQRSRDIELTNVHASINGSQPAPSPPLQLSANSQEGTTVEVSSEHEITSEPADSDSNESHEEIGEIELMGELNW
jgi:hypothetical protein